MMLRLQHSILFLSFGILFLIMQQKVVQGANSQSRSLRIINEAGFKVDIFWINRWKNNDLVKNNEEGVFHGAETQINSYVSHEFEIHELPNKRTGKCQVPEACKKGQFQVNANDEQLIVFKPGLRIVHTDNVSRAKDQAKDALKECKAKALENLRSSESSSEETFTNLMNCIDKTVDKSVQAKEEEISFQQNLRLRLGNSLSSYACLDPQMKPSEASENRTWTYAGIQTPVRVMLERSPSQIHYIEQFATDKECQAVEAAAKQSSYQLKEGNEMPDAKTGYLHAQLAHVDIPWEDAPSPITMLGKKMHRYVTDQIGINVDPNNDESLWSVVYEGTESNPARYENHCDGRCTGLQETKHEANDPFVTFITYCTVDTVGNATHFANAGVHILPKPGSAVFISYAHPTTGAVDAMGFTKYRECPVTEGTKSVVMYKIRK